MSTRGLIMLMGHRGAAALAPENTLASMQAAFAAGLEWIEIDTQLSADGTAVIFHDATVDRCTDGTGRVADLSLDLLRRLDAGGWFGAAFAGEKIPTLREALQLCAQQNKGMNLEIKVHHDSEAPALVKAVAGELRALDYPAEQILLSSFSKAALQACREMLPDVRRGYITEERSTDYLAAISSLDLFSVHVNYKILDAAMAQRIIAAGYQLNVWTLNDPTLLDNLESLGVSYMITDNPEAF